MTVDEFPYSLAVVIGIDDYRNGVPSLKTPVNDAQTLATILKDRHGYDDVKLLLNEAASGTALKNLLETELPKRLNKDDRLLFYFAGHGIALNGDDGPEGYLIPSGASLGDISTYLSMATVNKALLKLPCRHFLGILDCCFAGAFRWSSTRKLVPVELGTLHRERYDRFIRDPAWQVITSAASDQFAQDAFDLKSTQRGLQGNHSPFAAALIEALEEGSADAYPPAEADRKAGDGVITATELYLYLRDRVEPDAETRSMRQTPGIFPLTRHDKGEFIFLSPGHPLNLPPASPLDESSNPYRGLESFDEAHKDLFFGRQALTHTLAEFVTNHALTVVLGASGSGKSSLVKAGLTPRLRNQSTEEVFSVNLVQACILTEAILSRFPLFPLKLLPISHVHKYKWHLLPPVRPGESPFTALARTLYAIADDPATISLDPLAFLNGDLQQKHDALASKLAAETSKNNPNTSKVEQLTQEAEQLSSMVTLWQQGKPADQRRLLVEQFEMLYALYPTGGQESEQQRQLKQTFLDCLALLTQQLQSDLVTFAEIVRAWEQRHPDFKLLLVIDQLEELITLCRDQQERKFFLDVLAEAATHPTQLHLVLTLRSDFEPQFRNTALEPHWQGARFVVPAMTRDELRQAIEAPASARVMVFDPHELVDQLIDEVANMPGALPLLSFALSELYLNYLKRQKDAKDQGETLDRAMTQVDYEAMGGVTRSLTQRAERVYEERVAVDPAYEHTIRNVMLRMVSIGGELARRRVPLSELDYPDAAENERVKEAIKRFEDARLLTPDTDPEGKPYKEPAHDALVRGWPRLLDWKQKHLRELLLQRDLTSDANQWETSGKKKQDSGLLWIEDPRLPTALQLSCGKDYKDNWLNLFRWSFGYQTWQSQAPEHWLNTSETDFVWQSFNQKFKRFRRTTIIVVLVILSLSGLTGYALVQQSLATLSAQEANRQKDEAKKQEGIAKEQAGIALTNQNRAEANQKEAKKQEGIAKVQAGIALTNQNRAEVNQKEAKKQEGIAKEQAGIALNNQKKAETNQKLAEYRATVAQLREQAARVLNFLPTASAAEGLMLAIDTMNRSQSIPDLELTAQASLLNAVQVAQEINRLQGHENPVESVAFSRDGQQIVSSGNDGVVKLWNAQTGQPIGQPLKIHGGRVRSLAFSRDSRRIVSGGFDRTVRVWNAQTGQPIGQPLRGHESIVISVAFSPDGRRIVSGSDDNTVRLWDVQTGRPIGQPLKGHRFQVNAVAFSSDGQRVVSGSEDKTLRLWDAQTGQPIGQPLTGHRSPVNAVAFSPDGQRIVSGSNDGAQLWDAQTGQSIGQSLQGHESGVISVAFSPDSRRVVSASFGGTIRLWDAQTKQSIGQPLQGHGSRINSVAFSPDGQRIVSGSDDQSVRIWDAQTGQPSGRPLIGYRDRPESVAFSPDGRHIIISSDDNTVRLWDLQTGQPIGKLLQGHRIVSDSSGGTVQLREAQTGQLIGKPLQRNEGRVRSVAFSPDGHLVVIGSDDKMLRLWDIRTGQLIGKPFKGHQDVVESVAFSTDGRRIVSGSLDRTVRLWNVQTSQPIGQPLQGHESGVISVVFSPDGRRIVSGSRDKTVRLWDAQTGQPIGRPLQGHEDYVIAVAFSPDGQRIVSGSLDKTVRLWDASPSGLLTLACNRLQYHPLRNQPETVIADPAFLAVAHRDRAACQPVWQQQPAAAPPPTLSWIEQTFQWVAGRFF